MHGVPEIADVYESVREVTTDRVVAALALEVGQRPVVHAWWAYVEDRALTWADQPTAARDPVEALVQHCCAALTALLALQ